MSGLAEQDYVPGRKAGGETGAASPGPDRRTFLKTVGAVSAALVAPTPGNTTRAVTAENSLPQIRLGKHSISRLICGGNTFFAGSHLSVFVDHELRWYYTPARILKTLRRCQEVGINCFQSGGWAAFAMYRQFLDAGGKMHFLSLAAGQPSDLAQLAAGGCIGVAHHGELTDILFKEGKLDQVENFLKRVHDAGLPAGISTHMPAVVETVLSKDWEVDYFMTCVYERRRSVSALKKLLGHVPIPVGEVYLTEDPPRMYKAIRAAKQPCLAFKILAAGRLSERRERAEQAFRQTFEAIKPSDGVIVGMYDKFSDQPAENAALVRRFAGLSKAV
jgi:hypothetical protein